MSESIAHPETATLDTVAKLFRVLKKEGVSLETFAPPIQDIGKRKNLSKFLRLGCPEVKDDDIVDAAPSDRDLTLLILGDDLIFPEDVATARGVVYSDWQIKNLEADLPPLKDIVWCRDNGYILIPAPPRPLSFLEIYDLNRELVNMKTRTCEPFAMNDLTEAATWLGIRKECVPNSTDMDWKEQSALLSGVERAPNAPEFLWALTTYKEVRGVSLMPGYSHARTSSVASNDNHIWIGRFTCHGLAFGAGDGCHINFGVASARKFD